MRRLGESFLGTGARATGCASCRGKTGFGFRPPDAHAQSTFVGLALVLLCSWGLLPAQAAEWQNGPGYRSAPLTVPSSGRPGFTELGAVATGIHFSNTVPEQLQLTNQI